MKHFTTLKMLFLTVAFMLFGGNLMADKFIKIANHSDVTEDGVYLIVDVTSGRALTSANGSTAAPTAVSIPLSGDIIEGTIADDLKWQFTAADGGYTIYQNDDDSKWLYAISNNNGLRYGTGAAKVFELNITSETTPNYKGMRNVGQNRYIGVYNNQDWRTYTSVNNNIKDSQIEIFELDTSVPTVPTISVQGVVEMLAIVNGVASETVKVNAANLTAGITISGATAPFTVTPTSLGTEGGDLTITYSPTAAGTHTATLTLSSAGADNRTIELSGEAFATEGDGTKTNPFTLEDVTTLDNSTGSTKYWVKGYIVGANHKDAGGTVNLVTSNFANTAAATMIFIADDINEDDIDAMHPVQLPIGDVRDALNLVDNPSNYKRDVLVYGTLEAYFSKLGVRNVTDYELGAPTGPIPTITVSESSFNFTAEVDDTDDDVFEVEAENLTADMQVSITGSGSAMFSYELDDEFNLRTGGIGLIKYTPTVPGNHIATLTISSVGAGSANIALTGTATGDAPPLTIPNVIITEVYGGGGNSGATLKNDFIELYNTTDGNVSIAGWTVQYWSATGTGTPISTTIIPADAYIPAKTHFLIQEAAGNGGTVDLEYPDVIGEIAMGATAGKVVLYSTDEAQTIDRDDLYSVLNNAYFVDYVPFGKTAVPIWGSAMSSNPSATESATRKQDENDNYIYTGDIGNDFELADPSPESTGLLTSVSSTIIESKVYAHNQVVYVNTTAGTSIEIFNVAGQKIISQTAAVDGYNRIAIPQTGILIVKAGEIIGKVVM